MAAESKYRQTLEYLYQLRRFGTKLGLENSFRLAALAGNPHQQLRFIHVAGTNGKGSTCAMLESIYRAAGLKTGLFTSPHLVSFTERIQVNRQPIPKEDVIRLTAQLQVFLRRFPRDHHPTFFEVVTIMGLLYFLEQKCDLVLWETGLGGRLDSTNIVTPLASVITNIQFDHVRWLGFTLAEIAAEKAGIIKGAIPVITAENDPEPLNVIESHAARAGAPLIRVRAEDLSRPPLDKVRLSLMGEHQKWNAAVGAATVRCLHTTLPVTDDEIRSGLQSVEWPGRLQMVEPHPGRKWVLDGAHNPAGAEALRRAWQANFPEQKPVMILGLLSDKDWVAMCRALIPIASRLILAPVSSERSAAPEEIADLCRQIAPHLSLVQVQSLAQALALASHDSLVLVTGSLYFIGETMELLGITPLSPDPRERQLNEWDASAKSQNGKRTAGL